MSVFYLHLFIHQIVQSANSATASSVGYPRPSTCAAAHTRVVQSISHPSKDDSSQGGRRDTDLGVRIIKSSVDAPTRTRYFGGPARSGAWRSSIIRCATTVEAKDTRGCRMASIISDSQLYRKSTCGGILEAKLFLSPSCSLPPAHSHRVCNQRWGGCTHSTTHVQIRCFCVCGCS
jgi:hypothetical protein